MGLNQLFNKDLVFCLHAKDETSLFEQVASLFGRATDCDTNLSFPLWLSVKSLFPTGLDMEFLGKDFTKCGDPHTDIVHNLHWECGRGSFESNGNLP